MFVLWYLSMFPTTESCVPTANSPSHSNQRTPADPFTQHHIIHTHIPHRRHPYNLVQSLFLLLLWRDEVRRSSVALFDAGWLSGLNRSALFHTQHIQYIQFSYQPDCTKRPKLTNRSTNTDMIGPQARRVIISQRGGPSMRCASTQQRSSPTRAQLFFFFRRVIFCTFPSHWDGYEESRVGPIYTYLQHRRLNTRTRRYETDRRRVREENMKAFARLKIKDTRLTLPFFSALSFTIWQPHSRLSTLSTATN